MQPLKTFNQIYLLGRNTRAELPILLNSFQSWDMQKKTRSLDGVEKNLLCFYDMQLSQSHEKYFNRLPQTES